MNKSGNTSYLSVSKGYSINPIIHSIQNHLLLLFISLWFKEHPHDNHLRLRLTEVRPNEFYSRWRTLCCPQTAHTSLRYPKVCEPQSSAAHRQDSNNYAQSLSQPLNCSPWFYPSPYPHTPAILSKQRAPFKGQVMSLLCSKFPKCFSSPSWPQLWMISRFVFLTPFLPCSPPLGQSPTCFLSHLATWGGASVPCRFPLPRLLSCRYLHGLSPHIPGESCSSITWPPYQGPLPPCPHVHSFLTVSSLAL